MSLAARSPPPSLAWQFESSNVDSVTGLSPTSQGFPGPAQLVGSAQFVTNAPTSNTAVSFPGTTGSYMSLGTSTSTNFSTFTSNVFIEAWVYVNAFGASARFYTRSLNPNTSGGYDFMFRATSASAGLAVVDGVNVITGPAVAIPLSTWTHIAVSIETSSYATVFLNGTAGTRAQLTALAYTSTYSTFIGVGGSTDYYNGYIRDLRVVKGGIVPTSSFTPLAAAPFTYASPTYVANMGTTVFTLLSQFTPVYVQGKYGQAINFPNSSSTGTTNPTSNVVYTTSLNSSTGYTFAFWVNFNFGGVFAQVVLSLAYSNGVRAVNIYLNAGNQLVSYDGSTNLTIASPTVSTGTWYHVALSVTTSSRVLYLNGVGTSGTSAVTGTQTSFILGGDLPSVAGFSAWCSYDDLRVYNTALSAAQVQAVYNAQGMPSQGIQVSTSRQIYVAPTGTYPTYTPTSGSQFPVFNTSNVSFYSSGGLSSGSVGQYLNFGSQTFDMTKGFSAVCQFSWTNGAGSWERIFDLSNGPNANNIILARNGTSQSNMTFEIYNGNISLGKLGTGIAFNQNQVYNIVAVYNPFIGTYGTSYVYFNGQTVSLSYSAFPPSGARSLCYVGRSAYSGDAYSNVNINYLSVYNRVLTPDEIGIPSPTPLATFKGAPLFSQLSTSATASSVGAFSLRAINGTTAKVVNVVPGGTFPPSAMAPSTVNSSTQTLGSGILQGSYTASASTSAFGDYPSNAFRLFGNSGFAPYIWQVNSYPAGGGTVSTPTTTTTGATNYNGEWLQFQTPFAISLSGYSVGTQYLSSFVLLGSTTGATSSWTLIDSQPTIGTPGSYTTTTKTGLSTSAYTYFRFVILTSTVAYPLLANAQFYGNVPSLAQDFYADRLGNLLTVPVTGQTLANWLGGATGYVATWYDQSGKGQHMAQTTASLQPTINLSTSPASIVFTGNGTTSGQYFQNTIPFTFNFGTNYQYTIRAVVNNTVGGCLIYKGLINAPNSTSGEKEWYFGPLNGQNTGNYPNLVGNGEGWVYGQSAITTTKSSVTWSSSAFSSVTLYENASSVTVSYNRGNSISDPGSYLYIGRTFAGTYYYNGNLYELEIFSTPLSASDVTIMG
jgi:Concanavalin A-like lectin/glucanases superfamily